MSLWDNELIAGAHHPMEFSKNQIYEWGEILADLHAVDSPVRFLLRDQHIEKIVTACVGIEINPRAPHEILSSHGPPVAFWADKVCAQPEPVPVFVRELDNHWYYRGHFKVVGQSSDKNEIQLREKQANHNDVYKILFLREINQ